MNRLKVFLAFVKSKTIGVYPSILFGTEPICSVILFCLNPLIYKDKVILFALFCPFWILKHFCLNLFLNSFLQGTEGELKKVLVYIVSDPS